MCNGRQSRNLILIICHYFEDSVFALHGTCSYLLHMNLRHTDATFHIFGKHWLTITIFFVAFQLRRIKRYDAAVSAELIPYNIVPMEALSLTNAIRFFPEVSKILNNIYCNIFSPFSLVISHLVFRPTYFFSVFIVVHVQLLCFKFMIV